MEAVFHRFDYVILGPDAKTYHARVCGRPGHAENWEGWIEFEADDGKVLRTERETTQPNDSALSYWADGLTPVYLEGARNLRDDLPA